MNASFSKELAFLAAVTAGILPTAQASRTGLNNIPIADVSPTGTGVVQGYSAFGPQRKSSVLSGARVGLEAFGEKFEAGLDSRWRPGQSVPIFFNFKWVSHWDKSVPALGVGIASLAPRSQDRSLLGQPQSYAVLGQDFGFARLHAGYAAQVHNNAAFFGLDRSWMIDGHKLTFRSDLIEIQNHGQWLASAGLTYKLTQKIGLELWQSKPTESGKAYTTAKIGWQFSTSRK